MSQFLRSVASKLAAVALLGIVLFGLFVGLIWPAYERLQSLNERITTQRTLLGRYLVNAAPGSPNANSGSPQSSASSAPIYLPGETDSVRLASLQSTLNDAAKAQGIRLSSTRALDAGEQGGVRLLGLQTQLSTELAPLQALLFDLEKKRPNLMIDGLHIMRAPDTGSGRPPGLDVTFTLLGASPEKKD